MYDWFGGVVRAQGERLRFWINMNEVLRQGDKDFIFPWIFAVVWMSSSSQHLQELASLFLYADRLWQ